MGAPLCLFRLLFDSKHSSFPGVDFSEAIFPPLKECSNYEPERYPAFIVFTEDFSLLHAAVWPLTEGGENLLLGL